MSDAALGKIIRLLGELDADDNLLLAHEVWAMLTDEQKIEFMAKEGLTE